jgi:Family of unknown function (DUF6481)
MRNRSVPNLEERLKHASEARKSMLAKFKMSLVEGPAAIEKRQQRQVIAAGPRARTSLAKEDTIANRALAAAETKRCLFNPSVGNCVTFLRDRARVEMRLH